MYKTLKQILHITFFSVLFFFSTFPLWADDIFTTGLDLYNVTPYQVAIKWKSNYSNGTFSIYRSPKKIEKFEDLTNSLQIWKETVYGKPKGSLFYFPLVVDEPQESGNYFYAVIPAEKPPTDTSLTPNINTSLWPTTVDRSQIPVQPVISNVITNVNTPTNTNTVITQEKKTNQATNQVVKVEPVKVETNIAPVVQTNRVITNQVDIVIHSPVETNNIVETRIVTITNKIMIPRTNQTKTIQPVILEDLSIVKMDIIRNPNSFLLLWQVNRMDDEDMQFLLYKDSHPINSVKGRKPFKIIENELFYEDYDLKLGKNYYYAVVLSQNPRITKGLNMNRQGLTYGKNIQDITLVQEVYYEKIKLDSLKTNQMVIKENKTNSSSSVTKQSQEQKVVKKETPVKINQKQREKDQDQWIELQGTEKPGYLVLNKGLNGKKTEKKTENIPQNLSDIKTEKKVVTNYITLTNRVEKLIIVKKTNELTVKQEQRKITTNITSPEITKASKKMKVEEEWFVAPEPEKKQNMPVKKSKNDTAVVEAAAGYFKKEQYKKVLDILKNQDGPAALELKGKAAYYLEEYRMALVYFKKLEAAKPQTSELWIKLTMNRWGEKQ